MEITDEVLLKKLVDRADIINATYNSKTSPEKLLSKYLLEYLAGKETRHQEDIRFTRFSRVHKKHIWLRDKKSCFYCQRYLNLRDVSLDHKIPTSRGGVTTLANLTTSCKWCNSDKSSLTDDEYPYKQLANTAKGIYPKDID